jgi:hypothetical protein
VDQKYRSGATLVERGMGLLAGEQRTVSPYIPGHCWLAGWLAKGGPAMPEALTPRFPQAPADAVGAKAAVGGVGSCLPPNQQAVRGVLHSSYPGGYLGACTR